MKKHYRVLGVVLCLLLFTVFALGSGSSSDSNKVDKEITSVGDGSDNNDSTSKSTDKTSTNTGKSDTSSNTKDEMTVAEQVVLDAKDVKITVKGLESSLFGPKLKVLIENNTEKGLTFQIRNASVNGYMADTMMSEDVAAGKKVNSGITFTTSNLEACGITTFTDMEFSFHIFYSDNWDTFLDSESIIVETSAKGSHVQTIDDSGTVFYNQNGIKIIGKGLSSNESIFGPGLILYIENNSDKDITVQARDTSVNGFMIDSTMSEDVVKGKKAVTALTFFSSSLEENEITEIESIETSFHVFDEKTWDDIVTTEPIKINFK